MDEKPDQIMNHIESQRSALGRNLNELESRVKRGTDWRVQFDNNPMLMMGVALGGGLLLGSIAGGRKSRRSASKYASGYPDYTSASTSSMTEPRIYGSSYQKSRGDYEDAGAYGSGSQEYARGSSETGYPPQEYDEQQSSKEKSGFAGLMGSSGKSRSKSSGSPAYREQRRKASDTLENMRAALIAFATAKVKEFMSEALPGFNQHLDEVEQRNRKYSGGETLEQGSGQHDYPSYGSSQPGTERHKSGGDTGSPKTEQSTGSPYRQEPAGAGVNPGVKL